MSWSSERVSSTYTTRSRAAALLPLSSGRTLPSKWDDAERWISSPVLPAAPSFRSQRRRSKSHSDPLAPPQQQLLPPAADSPLPDGSTTTDNDNSQLLGQELECTRKWLILLNDPPLSESQDERSDEEVGEAAGMMGTSYTLDPEGCSTTTTTTFSSPSPNHILCLPPPEEPPSVDQAAAAADVAVKDVKVDKEGTFRPTRPRKLKHKNRADGRPAFTGSDLPISTSKSQREEAKINAWENLQRANAEAAIRKLEMKLEKKRATTMDKILKKLQRDELEAERMRRSISKNNGSSHRFSRKASQRITELCRRIRMSSITNFLPRT